MSFVLEEPALLYPPRITGWLVKKAGVGVGKLDRRFFVLSGPLCFYFKTNEGRARAKGIIPVLGAEVEVVTPKMEKPNSKGLVLQHCFVIRTRTRDYLMSAESAEVRDEWVSCCQYEARAKFDRDQMERFQRECWVRLGSDSSKPPKPLASPRAAQPKSPRPSADVPRKSLAPGDIGGQPAAEESRLEGRALTMVDFTTESYRET